MKYHNIIFYSIIPLILLSIVSLIENVQGQTTSTNQAAPKQENQVIDITAQALMKLDIFDLKDNLMDAKLEIVDRNLDEY